MMESKKYEFVGGEQDGKMIVVPGPIEPSMEFMVRSEEPYLPWGTYRLKSDGKFHYVGLILHEEQEPAGVA